LFSNKVLAIAVCLTVTGNGETGLEAYDFQRTRGASYDRDGAMDSISGLSIRAISLSAQWHCATQT
jgi:hypothetical protein